MSPCFARTDYKQSVIAPLADETAWRRNEELADLRLSITAENDTLSPSDIQRLECHRSRFFGDWQPPNGVTTTLAACLLTGTHV